MRVQFLFRGLMKKYQKEKKYSFSALSFIIFLTVWLSLPSVSYPAIGQFAPRIYDYSAELELNAAYDSNEHKSDGRGTETKQIFSRQKLNFYLTGYSYHPRFIQYSLKLSTGLKEAKFESEAFDTGWTTGSAWEYDFRAIVLPEHPYNLEVYTRRLEPLSRSAFSSDPSVTYSSGAFLRYKQLPYTGNLSYVRSTTETARASYTTTSYGADGSYFREYTGNRSLLLAGRYTHKDSSASGISSKSSSDTMSLNNRISIKNVSLGSGLTNSFRKQSSDRLSMKSNVFTWSENLNAALPWNFSTALSYTYAKSRSDLDAGAAPKRTLQSTSEGVNLRVNHKLYSSLASYYTTGFRKLSSSTGDTTSTRSGAGVNYSKKIPWGRLNAGASYSLTVTETEGAPGVSNEVHEGLFFPSGPSIGPDTGAGPGDFKLDNPDADPASLILFVRNPLLPEEFILLTAQADYELQLLGNELYIDIVNLPATPEFVTPGTFDFLVSYSLVRRDVKTETRSSAYSLSASFFKDLLNPYYRHYRSEQRHISGSFNGEPLDETIDIVGLLVNRNPFTFSAEYQNVRSNLSPYDAWRTDLTYREQLALNTTVHATVRYSVTNYSSGFSPARDSYTDKIFGLMGGVQQRFPRRNIALNVNGAYSHKTGLATSTTYTGSSALSWTAKKFLLTLGGSVSASKSEFGDVSSDRLTQRYYLNVRRTLF